jgi:thiamine pyrophosphokinase
LKVLIVADGDTPPRAAVERWLPSGPDLVIAADGGALKATALGYTPDVVVGDADSLNAADAEKLRAGGAEVVIHPAAKNESDTELALREAITRGAKSVLVIGAFGGARLEHTIANLMLLCLPEARGLEVTLMDAASTVRLLEPDTTPGGTIRIDGVPGDFVSLLPLSGTAEGVTTAGLDFPLVDEPLHQGPARGLSNVLSGTYGTVTVRSGRLLVIHTRGDL